MTAVEAGTGSNVFLSTPSARRATDEAATLRSFGSISIHALREEGDFFRNVWVGGGHYFYPRPPRGGRQYG